MAMRAGRSDMGVVGVAVWAWACVAQEAAATTRIRLGDGNLSIEAPAAARRRMIGAALALKMPEAGGRYARIRVALDDPKVSAADAQLHLRKLAAEQMVQAYKFGDAVFTLRSAASGEPSEPGTMHSLAMCNGAGVVTLTVCTPPDFPEADVRKLTTETIPRLLATVRFEKPWAGKPANAAAGADAGVDEADPAMQQAILEARATSAEFVDLLAKPGERKEFAVKAKFVEGADVEWLWIVNPKVTADGFDGTIGNDPVRLKKVKSGDRALVKRDAIGDWMCIGPDGLEGGYMVRLLMPTLSPEERAAMRKELKLVDE
jgi:uncharacterized protein YegJ (DUF2314 family)